MAKPHLRERACTLYTYNCQGAGPTDRDGGSAKEYHDEPLQRLAIRSDKAGDSRVGGQSICSAIKSAHRTARPDRLLRN